MAMRRQVVAAALGAAGLLVSAAAGAASAAPAAVPAAAGAGRVDNFVLFDQHGAGHELYYLSDARAVVLLAASGDCTHAAARAAAEVAADYASRGVHVLLVDSRPGVDRAAVASVAASLGLQLPLLADEQQLVGEGLAFRAGGEALLLDPQTWRVVWRGAVDDRFVAGGSAGEPRDRLLGRALDAHLSGEALAEAAAAPADCPLPASSVAAAATAPDAYATTIAPMLIENCVPCHHEGGIGPFAMTNYDVVRGFSLMMREVIRTRRMPPWHADPSVRELKNARGLEPEQVRTLVHWIEAGAPRGEGPDPLLSAVKPATEWTLGPPDMIVEIPAYDVPATGTIDYQFPIAQGSVKEDVWLRAAEVLPGARSVVHHVIAGFVPSGGAGAMGGGAARAAGGTAFQNHLVTYAPGAGPAVYPEGTGILLPAGANFAFQMHYTASGRAERDVSQLGLYFAKEKPKYPLRHAVVADSTIEIPPHEKAHRDRAYQVIPRDALLYSVFPHAHYRATASRFFLVHPDGREEGILTVPRYDFNWQRYYELAEPLLMPAGSKLVHETVWDNSAQKRGNPDPEKTIYWGPQSWDEMLYGGFTFRYVGEEAGRPLQSFVSGAAAALARATGAAERFRAASVVGLLDDNLDGRLQQDELKGRIGRAWNGRFGELDKDGDGSLAGDELTVLADLAARNRRAVEAGN
jgi:hypothetical protein